MKVLEGMKILREALPGASVNISIEFWDHSSKSGVLRVAHSSFVNYPDGRSYRVDGTSISEIVTELLVKVREGKDSNSTMETPF